MSLYSWVPQMDCWLALGPVYILRNTRWGGGSSKFITITQFWKEEELLRVGQSVESALIALAAIFLAHSAYFNNFRQKIPSFDASLQKRVLFNCCATKQCLCMLKMWGQPLSGFHWLSLAVTGSLPVSLWLSMALCDSHSGSHWLSLPLSGILWPSLAHYCSLISRIQPLIGSQGPCSALIADATMTHFIPLCFPENFFLLILMHTA